MQSPTPELKSHMVRAGAGAGKTRGLVERVVEVYREFAKVGRAPRIAVTTFTRKATQELKERLVLRACDDRDAGLLQFVSDPLRLHISTIHGLLNVFLKQVGHLSELDSGFQIADESEADGLARRALRDTLLNHPTGLRWFESYGFERTLKMMRRYDSERREHGDLVPATEDDLRAAAKAGRDIWRARLLELANGILEEVGHEKWMEYGLALKNFIAGWPGYGTDGLPTKPRRNPKNPEYTEWHDRIDEIVPEFREEFRKDAWDERQWPTMAAMWADFQTVAEEFSRKFSTLKEQQSRFEMADLELLTLKILREKPFLGAVFGENWDYWMVDEYQDTSPLQVTCLEALMNGQKRYLVGDPQQSIYLFRGADVGVFAHAEREMKAAGAHTEHRRRNFRSKPDLLHFINDFMSTVGDDFSPMETQDLEGPTRDCCVMLHAPNKELEMQAVVSRVSELVKNGAELQDICILGRTHQNLLDASRALKHFGYPTHVHASRGFTSRREVMDAVSLWAFLLNPHDNANLIALLRSPWFYVPDRQIEEWTAHRPDSLWRSLMEKKVDHREVNELVKALESVRENGVAKTFEQVLVSAAVLDLCLHNDPAGRKESNLWKLVMKARELESESTRSLLDLCERELNFDPMEASEGDANSAQEPNCINLMTVHGSKGLEFDHVIIPRMGEPQRLSPTEVLSVDSTGKKFFFPMWNEEDGKNISSLLDLAKTRYQRVLEAKEFARWLYVAVTRAKSTLTMTWSEIGNGSWAARSPWFMEACGRHEKSRYAWSLLEEWPEPEIYTPSRKPARIVRALWREPNAAVIERQAVTDLVAGPSAPIPYKKDLVLNNFQARSAGQRIHKTLESLKYNPELGATGDPALDYVLSLQEPCLRDLIRAGQVEWGFQVKTPQRIVEGQIDIWGKLNGVIYIADYKSGSPAKMKQAFDQLGLYAWALRKFGHSEPIELLVIYPLAQKTVKQKFKEDLFRDWEVKFSLAETAGEHNLGAALLDGGHGHVESDLVGR